MAERARDHVVECDVLVIGAGMAGSMAAIRAGEFARTLLVEKSTVGMAGVSTFAAGNMTYCLPEEREKWLKLLSYEGSYLNDPEWTEDVLKDSYEIINLIAKWGGEFIKDPDGTIIRKQGRGRISWSATFPGFKLMRFLAQQAKARGVEFLNRTMVIDLLTQDGRVVGATGFNARTGDFYVFKSKAVTLGTGGCAYKGPYFGQDMVNGEGYAMAHRVGAQFANMEFGTEYNLGYAHFDTYGASRFQGLGGKFLNAKGEEILLKYDPELGNKTTHDIAARAFAIECREGRGPIYLDASGMSPENQEFFKKVDNLVWKAFQRAGIDCFKGLLEWIPAQEGTIASVAGLKINRKYSTTVPGLYAGGDSATKSGFMGCAGGTTGHNLGFSCYSGYRAGENAAAFSKTAPDPVLNERQIRASKDRIYAPLRRKKGISPDEVIYKIQELVIPAQYVILRREDRLLEALNRVVQIRRELVPKLFAEDFHGLIKCHEADSIALTAEILFRSAIFRKDSRGYNYREDYPRDDKNWLKWVIVGDVDGHMKVWAEDLDREKFRKYGISLE